jgi:hypothetical protein
LFDVEVGSDEDAGLQHQPAGSDRGHLGVALDAGGVGEQQMVAVPADAGVQLLEYPCGAGPGEGAGASIVSNSGEIEKCVAARSSALRSTRTRTRTL